MKNVIIFLAFSLSSISAFAAPQNLCGEIVDSSKIYMSNSNFRDFMAPALAPENNPSTKKVVICYQDYQIYVIANYALHPDGSGNSVWVQTFNGGHRR
jgi:hypothetical protein